ncbi:MAG: type II toxin-antitoxin system HicB family antitoxin [Minisyncoccia bacterium]
MKKSQELQFNIMFRPEPEGGFTAIVPSLPGCISYGKDLKTAKKEIIDAIRGYIASVKKHKGKVTHDAESFMSSVRFSPTSTRTRQHA